MTDNYYILYGADAVEDLREIYRYIANVLLVPDIASAQVKRIRDKIRKLDYMPSCHALVEWEPWHSMNMHQLLVDNYIVYYLVDENKKEVDVVRIFYSGRNIEESVK